MNAICQIFVSAGYVKNLRKTETGAIMQKNGNNVAIIVLAAGLGTRMKSSKAKVLHYVCGKPMIMYVADTASEVAGNEVVLVIGHEATKVRQIVSGEYSFMFAYQKEQLGTGHAVQCALPLVPESAENVIIMCGDVPLIKPKTVMKLLDEHVREKRDISLLAVEIEDPLGYGRILLDSDMNVSAIVEEADATLEQKNIKTINSGTYCVKKSFLLHSLKKIKPNNNQKELYLTDIIAVCYNEGKKIGAVICSDYREVIGVNNPEDLNRSEMVLRNRFK